MSCPSPAELLRHRGPALLLASIEECAPERLVCTSPARAAWTWRRMLEAAAQTAGLLAGLQPEGPPAGVVAELRDVVVHEPAQAAGTLSIEATLDRRILHFWRCRVVVRADDGRVLLEGRVTLAPGREA